MTEELNGGCLDEREKVRQVASQLMQFADEYAKAAVDVNDGAYRDADCERAALFDAILASLSTSKQAEAEQCRTCGETQPHTGTCGTADSDTQALCKRTPPAVMPAAPSDAVEDDSGDLAERLRGRARYIRDQGGVKSAELMEAAADALSQTMQPQAGAVAYALQWPGEARLNLSTVFDTEAEASEYLARCSPGVIVVPLFTLAAPGAAIAAREQEADWLRELLRRSMGYVKEASTRYYDGTDGASMRLSAANLFKKIDAALASRGEAPATPQAGTDPELIIPRAYAGLHKGAWMHGWFSRGAALTQPTTVQQAERVCNNPGCGWKGHTNRMLGSIGPLCPECGETTEENNS